MPDTAPPTAVAHLKLLNCARGHFWESAVAEAGAAPATTCPTCGAPADEMPLLDLEAADEVLLPPPQTPLPPPYQDKAGKPVVAGYDVLEDLGRTTAGVVQHRAKQTVVNRYVVLKTVLARDDPSQQAWGALRGEAAALAKLPHPNIVGIFDAGDRERQLFYNAVELVEGPNLHALIGDKPLPVAQALTLVEILARTVHFAHEKGIVHRGLRPHNVLLHVQRSDKKKTETPEPPACSVHAALCIPKITGFGLAKARLVEGDVTDQELQDRYPCYLAPEQAWGRSKEIGPATDVYALGAILYECVAGKPPFKGSAPATTLEQIQTIDPLPLAQVRKETVPADVEAIVRRCLHKQPRRRYASARELADDLRRAAEGKPSKARDANFFVRSAQWSRRNPMAFVALAVVLLGLLAIVSVTVAKNSQMRDMSFENVNLAAARMAAEAETKTVSAQVAASRQRADLADYFRETAQADALVARGQLRAALALLDGMPADMRGPEWYLLRQQAQGRPPVEVGQLEFPVSSVAWSPDGQNVAASGAAAAANFGRSAGEVRAWYLADKTITEWSNLPGWLRSQPEVTPVRQVAFGVAGERLFWINSNGLTAWNRRAANLAFSNNLAGRCSHFCTTADGHAVLVTNESGAVFGVDARTGAFVAQFPGFEWGNTPVARIAPLNPDGSRYAIVSPNPPTTVGVFDGPRPVLLAGHTDAIVALAYHPGTDCLATGSRDGTVRLWRQPFGSGKPAVLQCVTPGSGQKVTAIAFTHDGSRLATCGTDEFLRIWDTRTGTQVYFLANLGPLTAVAFSPKDYRLALGQGQRVTVWGTPVP